MGNTTGWVVNYYALEAMRKWCRCFAPEVCLWDIVPPCDSHSHNEGETPTFASGCAQRHNLPFRSTFRLLFLALTVCSQPRYWVGESVSVEALPSIVVVLGKGWPVFRYSQIGFASLYLFVGCWEVWVSSSIKIQTTFSLTAYFCCCFCFPRVGLSLKSQWGR